MMSPWCESSVSEACEEVWEAWTSSRGLLIMEDDLDEGHEEDESDVTPTSSTSTDLACLLSIRKLSIFQFLVDKNLLPK